MRLHCFQNFGEFPTLQPRFKGLTVTPRFLRLPCRRDTCLCAVRPHFTPIELRVFPPFQPRFKSPTLPQPSLQPRHAPVGGASPHLPKNCKKNPPLHPRRKGPTVTPRFLSLLHSGDTRVFGRCVLTSTQKSLRELPPLHRNTSLSSAFSSAETHASGRCVPTSTKNCESFHLSSHDSKGPTVSPRFLSLPHSGDTRLWAVRPNFNQKNGRVSTFPTTIQKSHRNTSLPQPSLQLRHTRFRALRLHFYTTCARVSTSPITIQRSHRNTSLQSAFPTAETRAFGRCVSTASKKKCKFPPLHLRCKGPTVTCRFLSLPYRGDTRVSGGAPPLHRKSLRELPPLHPRFKGPTVTRRFFSHTCSRDTRLWAVRPEVSQKKCKSFHLSNPRCKNPTVTRRFPQPSLQRRHTRPGRCVPTSTKNLGEFPPLQPRCKSPTVTPRFLSLLFSGDTRLFAVRPHFTSKKVNESCHLSTHDSKVLP